MESMKHHCKSLLDFQKKGSVVFDYGNNLRGQALKAGLKNAFDYPGFVPAYIRPMFCVGRGPFRWLAFTGNPEDILKTDKAVMKMFPKDRVLTNWITLAENHLPWEGLPARVCWLGYGERAKFALVINKMVRDNEIGPIAITRDHLDSGSVASPYRETEAMRDKSDAIADWPLLNALLNCAAGADSVHIHNGGGVGIGLSTHAGMVVVCDGTTETDERIKRVFTTDPGIGVARHADAGYEEAIELVQKNRYSHSNDKKKRNATYEILHLFTLNFRRPSRPHVVFHRILQALSSSYDQSIVVDPHLRISRVFDDFFCFCDSFAEFIVPEIQCLCCSHELDTKNTVGIVKDLEILNRRVHPHGDKIFLISSCRNRLNRRRSRKNPLFNNKHIRSILTKHQAREHPRTFCQKCR